MIINMRLSEGGELSYNDQGDRALMRAAGTEMYRI
jgi:hypothetical protein